MAASLSRAGGGDVEDLAAQRQHRLAGAVARLLGRAAGRIALDDEELGARRAAPSVQSASLPGRRSLRVAVLRGDLLLGAAAQPLLGPVDDPVEQLVRLGGEAASQWSNASRIAVSTMREASSGRELVLGLALEFRLADEHREHARRRTPSRRRR